MERNREMIHIENINVYMQSNPELDNESIAKQSQGVDKAQTETSAIVSSTPIPPPGYDWISSFEYARLKQQSDAWKDVCDLLTVLDPNWHSGPGTGRVKALKAIHRLAGSNHI